MATYANDAYEYTENKTNGDVQHPDAVRARNVWKSYGLGKKAEPVLKNLSMKVGEGTIYTLLGPSGCGKTTLLSCILGLRVLNSGSIHVFGCTPGTAHSGVPGAKVGYMPQDIALHKELSVKEIFSFFGRMYMMSQEKINERLQIFIDFLELPPSSRHINSLSGGQQRRVSLAVALLHNPPLLIFDEPTVGVDPILKHKIWEYISLLTKDEKRTVIITTHYVEEARNADMVGMMHSGNILEEMPPGDLLRQYNAVTLEEVFYKICVNQQSDKITPVNDSRTTTSEPNAQQQSLSLATRHDADSPTDGFMQSFHRMNAIHLKTYSRLLRSPAIFLFLIVMPSFIMGLFRMAIGVDPADNPVAVYNGEYPNDTLCHAIASGCYFGNLSCRFLQDIDRKMLQLIPYSDPGEAKEAVVNGKVRAAILFPTNYSDAFQVKYILQNEDSDDRCSRISLVIDKSDLITSGVIQRVFLEGYKTFFSGVFNECDINVTAALPVDIDDPIPENAYTTYSDYFIGGVFVFLFFFYSAVNSSVTFISDRREGVLDRLASAGVTTSELVCGLLLNELATLVMQVALSSVFAFFVYKFAYFGGFFNIFLISFIQGICGLAFGFMVAVTFPDEKVAFLLLISFLFFTVTLGGFFWPMEGMPYYARLLCEFLPTTLATKSSRFLIQKPCDITHPEVWPGFVVSIVWILIFFGIIFVILRKSNRR